MTAPQNAENPAALLLLVRALWEAHDVTSDWPIECSWDELPEPQKSNWVAVARAASDRGVRVSPASTPPRDWDQDLDNLPLDERIRNGL